VIETPEAQCLGVHTFRYAFMPCTSREFVDGTCLRAAYEHNHPLVTHPVGGRGAGGLPPSGSFVTVPAGLILTALKRGEENHATTYVRVWNPTDGAIEGSMTYFRDIAAAGVAGLGEEGRGELPVEGRSVGISVAPRQILTVALALA
jgi:alpha-mannosidase